jgi:hypothetical protein
VGEAWLRRVGGGVSIAGEAGTDPMAWCMDVCGNAIESIRCSGIDLKQRNWRIK